MQWLIDSVLAAIINWLVKFGVVKVKQAKKDKDVVKEEKSKAGQLKKAQTEKEVEDAVRNTLDDL